MKTSIIATASLVLATAIAQPSSAPHYHKRAAPQSAIDILTKIAPTSASCSSDALYPGECATASDAAEPLINALAIYQISTPAEQAALLSWMAYESAEFKYVRNHFPAPGRPGQGTRAMVFPEFVSEFASTVPLSNPDPAGLLDDVINAGGEWAAACWYYNQKCTDDIKQGVRTGGYAGWSKFITDCVQTTVDGDREAYWTTAVEALGPNGLSG